jgi:hypothetical protein
MHTNFSHIAERLAPCGSPNGVLLGGIKVGHGDVDVDEAGGGDQQAIDEIVKGIAERRSRNDQPIFLS